VQGEERARGRGWASSPDYEEAMLSRRSLKREELGGFGARLRNLKIKAPKALMRFL